MQLPSIRLSNFLALLVCLGLVSASIYLEFSKGLNPCPLCILQRIIYIILGILFLGGSIFSFARKSQRYYHGFILLIALGGLSVAARQVWLTLLPANKVPACGANLYYLLQILPLNRVVFLLFQGTGECAKVTWRWLTLSMPEWSLLCFALFAVFALYQMFRRNPTVLKHQ